jgi:hypothetical protein
MDTCDGRPDRSQSQLQATTAVKIRVSPFSISSGTLNAIAGYADYADVFAKTG